MVIAIDGPSCAGKSTLAVMCAERLGIRFLNTGMIYRAIAYLLDEQKIDVLEEDKIQDALLKAKIEIKFEGDNQIVFVDGKSTKDIVSLPKMSGLSSLYSQVNCVREVVKQIQHEFAKTNDVVIEGRDIGTEIFPNAEYKFFVTASIQSRAKRRHQTFLQNGENIEYQQVVESLLQRDYNDTHRQISPLRQAKDAVVIDTSDDTVEQSLQKILSHIKK